MTTTTDLKAEILTLLSQRLGAASLDELAHATGRSAFDVLDALWELERDGLVQPTIWRVAREAG